jgi:glycosyltransferase involved in cell wall biosynthesis
VSIGTGVNVIGYHDAPSGLGEVARLVVRTLAHAGIEHRIVAVEEGLRPPWRRAPIAPYPVNLVCVNADMLPRVVQFLGRDVFDGRRTIGFWWWEVDRFPSHLRWAAQLLDEIWVGSEHVRGAIADVVGRPVHVFPLPIPAPATASPTRVELGLPEGWLFLFAFSYPSVFERKNPLGVIEAFSRAFAPGEASLVIKSSGGALFKREEAVLRRAAALRDDVVVIDGDFDANMYHALVQAADAYVSLHRAEGFGLTIAEAMALGKPAIATAYSGNLEFMSSDNSYLFDYDLVAVPPGTPYPSGARWAEPNIDDAARLLREVYEDRGEAARRGSHARADFAAKRSFDAAAEFARLQIAGDVRTDAPVGALDAAAVAALGGVDIFSNRGWLLLLRRLVQPLLRPYVEHDARVTQHILEAIREGQDRLDDRLQALEARIDSLERRQT